MAISYRKYVDVKSSFAEAAAEAVDLTGLVICPHDAAMKSDAISAIKTAFDQNKMVTLNATSYRQCFAEPVRDSSGAVTSDPSKGLYDFCTKYFSYVSPSGGVASAVRVMKRTSTVTAGDGDNDTVTPETPAAAFARAVKDGDSFGTVFFIGEYTANALNAAAEAVKTENNDYRMVLQVSHLSSSASDYYTKFCDTVNSTTVQWKIAGLTYTECPYLSMAICAATDYDGTNTATTHEFKTLNEEKPTVSDDATKSLLDNLTISYYGTTKANGATKSFYQEGFNADGIDTACYDNEMWMKRSIVAGLLNLETTVEKIPPTPSGVSMVVNVITEVVNKGLKNGSVLPEKPIVESQKALVIQLAGGDRDAPFKLNQYGYILAADLVPYSEGGKQKYKIVYRLIYLKGDAVRLIEGTHCIF